MDTPGGASRHLATVNGYQGLIVAIRARKNDMRISDRELEEVTNMAAGSVSKYLAPGAIKTLGPLSMGKLLRGLGLELIVTENETQTAKIRELYTERTEYKVRKTDLRAGGMYDEIIVSFTRRHMKKIASMGGIARKRLPKWKRTAMARKAVRARWSKSAKAAAVP